MANVAISEESFWKLDQALSDLGDLGGYVSDWLDEHPEATTTVEDDSITSAKLNASVALTSDEIRAILV